MNYTIHIDGCEGQIIEVKPSTMFAGPKLFVNGQPAPKGAKRNEMLLRRNDGKEIVVSWKPAFLGLDVPQLSVDGKIINVVEPLQWYEWVWSGLSVLLIFSGGLIGGVIGFLSFSINTKLFRTSSNPLTKYLTTAGVSIIAVMVYLVVAGLFLAAIQE